MGSSAVELYELERTLVQRGELVVGLDEVGRGALAGPLTVGAVVISSEVEPPKGLNDSKLLTAAKREALVEPLQSWAHAYAVGSASSTEVDAWGLRLALAVAATRAMNALSVVPTYAMIDGSFNLLRSPLDLRFGAPIPPDLSFSDLPATTLVKGDRRCASIAAAAVLAKVQRDQYMVELHDDFVEYQWAQNKGYGSAEHLDAIRKIGPCQHHRTSWSLPEQQTPAAAAN